MEEIKLLTLENPVLRDFLFYCLIVLLRMMLLSPTTVMSRMIYGVRDNLLIMAWGVGKLEGGSGQQTWTNP